jgi:hypothetical protein
LPRLRRGKPSLPSAVEISLDFLADLFVFDLAEGLVDDTTCVDQGPSRQNSSILSVFHAGLQSLVLSSPGLLTDCSSARLPVNNFWMHW